MNVFDIIGPVMIGPSSSHTAGAVRIGRIARALLSSEPVKARIGLYGSFAKTYKGHGTDKALVGGILGMEPDDIRIRESLALASKQGLDYSFEEAALENAHPNTALISLTGRDGETVSVQGASVGGGNIMISRINGLAVELTGQSVSLIVLHEDTPGIIATVTNFVAAQGINIGSLRLTRDQKGGLAVMTLEVDSPISPGLNAVMGQLPHVISSTVLNPQ
ncbi:MAG: L-serine ammonia-lyase, iron-sulfur-dependent subunit beta [Oscillospiraceae bacterium]|nr:L-serine ammonia-lyase, iron-sulfur-dependent subunit beta [Oscillospiraceae bacterium]